MSTTVQVGAVPGSTNSHAFKPIVPVVGVIVTPVGSTSTEDPATTPCRTKEISIPVGEAIVFGIASSSPNNGVNCDPVGDMLAVPVIGTLSLGSTSVEIVKLVLLTGTSTLGTATYSPPIPISVPTPCPH